MQRSGPNSSIAVSMDGFHASASSVELRPAALVEREPVDRHPHAAHLEHRVRTSGDVGEVAPPLVEDRRSRLGRLFFGNRATEVVHDEGQVGEGVEGVGELGELRVEQPDVVGEAATLDLAQPAPVAVVEEEVPRHLPARVTGVALVPHDVEPHALEPVLTGLEVTVERAADVVGTGEVGPAHDAGGHPRASAGRAGRAVAQDELRLADRAEGLVAVGPERRHALDEHGGLDVVTTTEIGVQRRRVVGDAVPGRPEVVMRVDDRQLRFEDVLLRRVLAVDLGEVHGAPFLPLARGSADATAAFSAAILHAHDRTAAHRTRRLRLRGSGLPRSAAGERGDV